MLSLSLLNLFVFQIGVCRDENGYRRGAFHMRPQTQKNLCVSSLFEMTGGYGIRPYNRIKAHRQTQI